jgi:D-xylose transport system substrate-binding protein
MQSPVRNAGGMTRRDIVRRGAAAGLGVSGLAMLLQACGDSDEASKGGGARGALTIGFALPTLAQRRWGFDQKYAEERAKELGHKVISVSANDSDSLQQSQVENLIARQIDALILSPFNVETSAASVSAAKQQNIPVVSYNSVVQNAPLDFWVARSNPAVGRIQAENAVKAKPKGNYLIVGGDPGVDISKEKAQGNKEILKPLIDSGDITIVSEQYHANYDPAKGANQVEAALSKTGNKIDAILCTYDGFIVSAMPVLKQAGLLGKTYLAGEDVFDEAATGIVDGTVGMSSYTDLKEMATVAVDAAVALVQGKDPASDATIDNGSGEIPGKEIRAYAVTKENMAEFLRDTGWLEVSTVYKNQPRSSWPKT